MIPRLPATSCGATIDHGSILRHPSGIVRAESARIVGNRWRVTARNLSGIGSMIDDADQFQVVKC